MERVRFIEHKGKKILYIDFSNCSEEESLDVIEQGKKEVKSQPENSLLTLTNVNKTKYNSKVVGAFREFTKGNKPYVRAAAIIGLSKIKKMIFKAVKEFSQRPLQEFSDEEKAKDWLVIQ